ncbi:uncharacterized protein LOC142171825 [Nicotiana tabacum]|uniref:Uncharacterized protein LOC142171825 n=1 Tax=Nicotiana tabacum TaxID=4097 RepID=A0AC58T326_TOBAC
MDELVGNLNTYEMKTKTDSERKEPKKEKNLVLKAENNDSSEEDSDMEYLTRRFQKMVRRNGGHFIKDYPLLKQEHFKHNSDKAAKRNPVPEKRFKRKSAADNVVKQALAAWGDSSSESEEENDAGDSSMLAVETNVLIDAYHSLVSDKDALTIELGDAEQTRDDLVVCIVDLKETIENLKNEKENALVEKVAITEQERDNLLVVIANLEETIEELKADSRPGNSEKGKEIASEAHIKLENELNIVKTSLCVELEKNRQLQAELEKGIGFQREKVPYNPHSKYVIVPDNWLCTHSGNNGHFKKNCQARVQSVQKNKVFPEKGTLRGSSQQWIMDSGCSKHMTGNTMDFLSLKALQGGNGNKVEFLSKICTITNLVTSEVVLVAKRYKNIYVADFKSLQSGDMSYLKAVDDDAELWHGRLGHASFSLLNKLIQKDLVHGLPNSKFKEHKVCDACARGKHVKSLFKPKKEVRTSKPLELLHMDLCGPMRVPSRGGKRYIFVIVDDYSRFTWTLFLKRKDETFEVIVSFVKKIQVKMESKVACIRSDHGTEFDNAKFDEFCSENDITHNFSALRTPQQNGVVGRKNRTLEDMARTMLIDSGIAKNFWAEAINTACYLVNRYMIRFFLNKTPYELLNGRKPKLTHLRTFGCK